MEPYTETNYSLPPSHEEPPLSFLFPSSRPPLPRYHPLTPQAASTSGPQKTTLSKRGLRLQPCQLHSSGLGCDTGPGRLVQAAAGFQPQLNHFGSMAIAQSALAPTHHGRLNFKEGQDLLWVQKISSGFSSDQDHCHHSGLSPGTRPPPFFHPSPTLLPAPSTHTKEHLGLERQRTSPRSTDFTF